MTDSLTDCMHQLLLVFLVSTTRSVGRRYLGVFWAVHLSLLSIPVITTAWAWTTTNLVHALVRSQTDRQAHARKHAFSASRSPLIKQLRARIHRTRVVVLSKGTDLRGPLSDTLDVSHARHCPTQVTFYLFHWLKGSPVSTIEDAHSQTQWEQASSPPPTLSLTHTSW
jgi:hypothetical protein